MSRFWLRLVEFFLRFTTTVGNLGREKIDFIGVATLLAAKTSFNIVAHKKEQKQTIKNKHNKLKNSNWPGTNHLAIYKRDRGVQLGTSLPRTNPASG